MFSLTGEDFSAQLTCEIRHNPGVHSDLPRDSVKRMRILERLLPTPRSLLDNCWFRPFRAENAAVSHPLESIRLTSAYQQAVA